MEEERPLLQAGPTGEDKIFAALGYVSILFVVPLILKHDSDYVYFHARQGLTLFLAEVVIWFVLFMLESFVVALAPRSTLNIVGMLGNVAWLLFVAVSLIGIYFASLGKKWEMPVLGKIARGINI